MAHYLLECPAYAAQRTEMVDGLISILPDLQHQLPAVSRRARSNVSNTLIYGIGKDEVDYKLFECVAKFIKESNRFKWP